MIQKKNFILVLVSIFVALIVAAVYVRFAQNELALTLQVRIAEQGQTLQTISALTQQNRADTLAESIIRDCSLESRARYESLLNRLSQLTAPELQELQQLFDACAGYFAERKAIMVARLSRELEVYADYVQLFETIKNADALIDLQLETWERLVTLEQERAQLMAEQVSVQEAIITALQAGSITSENVETLLVRAQQISQRAAAINGEVEAVRIELQPV